MSLLRLHRVFSALVALAFAGTVRADEVGIAVVRDGDAPLLEDLLNDVRAELAGITPPGLRFRWIEDPAFNAAGRPDRVPAALSRATTHPDVTIVLAGGWWTIDHASRSPTDGPLVVAALPTHGDAANAGANIALIPTDLLFAADVEALRSLVPGRRITALVPAAYVTRLAADLPADAVIPYTATPEETLNAITAHGADAVYLLPAWHWSDAQRVAFYAGLAERGIASLAFAGERAVRAGAMAGRNADLRTALARRIAFNLRAVATGTPATELSQPFVIERDRWFIHADAFRAAGLTPSIALFQNATIVGDLQPIGRGPTLDLRTAVDLALAANTGWLATGEQSRQAEARVKQARANLLPQVNAAAVHSRRDPEQRSVTLGVLPRDRTSGEFTLTQTLFSDQALTGLHAAREQADAATDLQAATRLDLIGDTATSYLRYLQARALHRIARDGLAVTRSHLALAANRESTGASGPQDRLRFEAAEAADQSAVATARAREGQALLQLNRQLGAAPDTDWQPAELDLASDAFATTVTGVRPLVNDVDQLHRLASFLVVEALAASPELRAAEHGITALDHGVREARRRPYTPTVGFQATYAHIFDETRLGSRPGDAAGNGEWSAGLAVNFELFSGGRRTAVLRERESALRAAHYTRDDLAQGIELRVRAALQDVAATSADLKFSATAVERADRNLAIVGDHYERGLASVVTLIDAQNAAFTQRQNAALAVHQFLGALVQLERAIGRFEFLESPAANALWADRLCAALFTSDPTPSPFPSS